MSTTRPQGQPDSPKPVFSGHLSTVTDLTCDHTLPTSLVGRDYVTFPSLPPQHDVTDSFLVVALHSFTTINVNDSNAEKVKELTLLCAGDSTDLRFSAFGFHHVTGNSPFYLYAKLAEAEDKNGRRGLCSLTLLPDFLFREAYSVAVVWPLVDAASVYVAVIVKTQDTEKVEVVSARGGDRNPVYCEDVAGTGYSGCYFDLTSGFTTVGAVFRVQMDLPSPSQFGAYLLARPRVNDVNLMCYHLGMPAVIPEGSDYDYTAYIDMLKMKPMCEELTSTAAPITTISVNGSNITTDNTNINTTATTATIIFDTTPAKPPECGRSVILNRILTELLKPGKMEEVLGEIVTKLSVKKENLPAVVRKKVPAPDTRTSSTNVGYFSVSFVAVFFTLVVLVDCWKLFLDIRSALCNIRCHFS